MQEDKQIRRIVSCMCSKKNTMVRRTLGTGWASYIRYWSFSFVDPVAKNLVQYLPSYHKHINMLKDNGYCQKSRTPEDAEVRTRLLQSMVKHLKERSLVEHEFISPWSSSSEKFSSRDCNTTCWNDPAKLLSTWSLSHQENWPGQRCTAQDRKVWIRSSIHTRQWWSIPYINNHPKRSVL